MTDRELMQQALDAMLNFPNDISDEMFESIKALRARLAQPEPYAAQAAMVAQQTQGRMRIDPVTGDVGIGTVKSQRGWQGLTEDDAIQLLPVMPYEYDVDVEMILKFAEAIEAKLKEKNA